MFGQNTRDAGDLRRHRAHYDVTAMSSGTVAVSLEGRGVIILSLEKKCRNSADAILKMQLLNENYRILSKKPLMCVPTGQIDK